MAGIITNGINGINTINSIATPICLAIMEGGESVNYIEIYKRVLNYHREYSGMKGIDDEWERCVKDGEAIAKGFDNGQFARDLIIAVQKEISRKLKEVERNEQRNQV